MCLLLITRYLLALYSFVLEIIRGIIKGVLRRTTRLSELQRIVYGELRGARRVLLVEQSLLRSRNPCIMQQLQVLEDAQHFDKRDVRKTICHKCAIEIAQAKGIPLKPHLKFIEGLEECLEVIYTYKYMLRKILLRQGELYDNCNEEHEHKLLTVWKILKPDEQLSARRSRQWTHIGFQGLDPATDFRGGGALALDVIHHSAVCFPEVAKRLLENSNHKLYEYPLCVLLIQVAVSGSDLTKSGVAKTHFYNRFFVTLTIDHHWREEVLATFYEFCLSLACEFENIWIASRPQDMMQFQRIKSEVDKLIIEKLQNPNACFLMNANGPPILL